MGFEFGAVFYTPLAAPSRRGARESPPKCERGSACEKHRPVPQYPGCEHLDIIPVSWMELCAGFTRIQVLPPSRAIARKALSQRRSRPGTLPVV
jgi:hypothetical protein